VTLDCAVDGVKSCRPEQACEHWQRHDAAPVAAPRQVDNPVGTHDCGEADCDDIAEPKDMLMRQDTGRQERHVFGERKANATTQ
jgi:hypothetical protein